MTPQELRNSILLSAIQGKLVEQRSEEGTGEELFQSISFAEKKPLKNISEAEIPYELPNSWKWVRHNTLFEIVGGSQPPKSHFLDNQQAGCVRLYQIRDYGDKPVPVYVPEKLVTKFTKKGDILLARYGASVGKVFLAEDGAYNVAMAKVTPLFTGEPICKMFLFYYYLAPLYQFLVKNNTRSAQAGFNKEDLNDLLFPLPPLEEQKRIVAKLEELLPLIDRYEAAWNKLEEFNKRFPVDMQKSILQMAIQGKLVPKLPEDGTGEELFQQIQAEKQALIKAGKIKKEKPLPEIAEDEIPFEIPDTWKWVRLRELGFFSSGKTPTMGDAKYWANGTVPWITSKDMKKKYLDWSEMQITQEAAREMRMYQPNTILMVVRSGILKRLLPVAILTGESTINQDIKAFSLHLPEMAEYVYYILKGMETYILKEYRKQVTTVDSLRFEEFQNMPVPIPPRAEQKRIIAKLEEILPLCDRLK